MNNTLIVCEKPLHRHEIETYCCKNLPQETLIHYDLMATVVSLNQTILGPVKVMVGGYRVGDSNVRFEHFELHDAPLDTSAYIIDSTKREKCPFFISYEQVVFACGASRENVMSAFEYCERHNIPTDKSYFANVLCTTESCLAALLDKEKWVSLSNFEDFLS